MYTRLRSIQETGSAKPSKAHHCLSKSPLKGSCHKKRCIHMADTVINLVEKCQQPEWAGMLPAGMLRWASPLLQSALPCSLFCCTTIKEGSSGVNLGSVWRVTGSKTSNPCPWLYNRSSSLCNLAAGEVKKQLSCLAQHYRHHTPEQHKLQPGVQYMVLASLSPVI